MVESVVGLLIHDFLDFFLGSLQPGVDPRQRLLRDNQASRDNRLSGGKDAIATALLVFRSIGVEEVVLDIACDAHRVASGVVDSTADLLGIFSDDGEASIDLAQTLVTESIGTSKVRCNIVVGRGEVGQDGLGQAGVALVGELDGLGTVWVALEDGDGVGDDGVRGEVLVSHEVVLASGANQTGYGAG